MSTDREREDEALDALIAASYQQASCDDILPEHLRRLESALTPEDRDALAALGDDLAARIVDGTWNPSSSLDPAREISSSGVGDLELAGSMQRGEGDLTDAARAEMEERLRELTDEETDEDDGEQQP